MNVIIPSYVRVGSTLVATMSNILIGEQQGYMPIAFPHYKEGDSITSENLPLDRLQGSCVIKTHDAPPSAFVDLLSTRDDTICIVIKRNFLDTFVSIWHYERNNRGEDLKLPRQKEYQDILTDYPNITDNAGINLLVEREKPFIISQIEKWNKFSQTIIHKNYLIVDYDRISSQGNKYLLDLLKTKIPCSIERENRALVECEFDSMKKDFGKGFVRNGKSGEWKSVYDQQSINIIEGVLNQLYSK